MKLKDEGAKCVKFLGVSIRPNVESIKLSLNSIFLQDK